MVHIAPAQDLRVSFNHLSLFARTEIVKEK